MQTIAIGYGEMNKSGQKVPSIQQLEMEWNDLRIASFVFNKIFHLFIKCLLTRATIACLLRE